MRTLNFAAASLWAVLLTAGFQACAEPARTPPSNEEEEPADGSGDDEEDDSESEPVEPRTPARDVSRRDAGDAPQAQPDASMAADAGRDAQSSSSLLDASWGDAKPASATADASGAELPDLFGPGGPLAPKVPGPPSPDNPKECPPVAPDNPIGSCLGVPVYATCTYGTYSCICDWFHWICI